MVNEMLQEIYRSDLKFYRFKSLREMQNDFGSNWRENIEHGWSKDKMDPFLGKDLDSVFDMSTFRRGLYDRTSELNPYFYINDKSSRTWTITKEMLAPHDGMVFIPRYVLQVDFTKYVLKGLRLKTEQEFKDAYGENWRYDLEVPVSARLAPYLGEPLADFVNLDSIKETKPASVTGRGTVTLKGDKSILPPIPLCGMMLTSLLTMPLDEEPEDEEYESSVKKKKIKKTIIKSIESKVTGSRDDEYSIFKQVIAANPKDLDERYK